MAFRDTNPYTAFGGKIDPITEIRNAGILTSGNVYWVKDPSDDDYITFKESVGNEYFSDTIQGAIDKCTNDQNDYVMVCPKKSNAVWQLSAAIDLNKNKVHLISVGYNRTNVGYTNTLEGYAATTTHDDEFIHVTGTACEIAGFKLSGTGAATAATGYGTIDNGLLYLAGPDCYVHDCQIEVVGSAASAWDKLGKGVIAAGSAAAPGALFENVNVEAITVGAGTPTYLNTGEENKEWKVKDCTFTWWGGDTDQEPIIAGTGNIGLCLFDNCKFVNINSGTTPVSLCNGNVTAGEGLVLFHYCSGVYVDTFGTDASILQAPSLAGTSAADTLMNPGLAALGTASIPVGA